MRVELAEMAKFQVNKRDLNNCFLANPHHEVAAMIIGKEQWIV